MFLLSLTYQQVMPAFLDFVFPFGMQARERDFNFGGFRQQTRLPDTDNGLRVPELGWSGRDYQLCFNLKSVEQAKGGGEPWSIRQSAIHHSFDIESGKASWIIVKANKLLQERVKSATISRGLRTVGSYDGLDRAFASTLATHLIFCEWAGQNWRWYINFLEDNLQDITQHMLSPVVRTPTSPKLDVTTLPRENLILQDCHSSPKTLEHKRPPQSPQSKSPEIAGFHFVASESKHPPPPPPPEPDIPEFAGFHFLAGEVKDPPQSPYDLRRLSSAGKEPKFSITDLQRIQGIEGKANAAKLILKTNISVFVDLKIFYKTVSIFQGWPSELSKQSHGDMLRFEQTLSSMENDMRLQISRVEMLLQLITDRKNLVSRISLWKDSKLKAFSSMAY